MRLLFDKTFINKLELKNRFIRSATIENIGGKNGHLSDKVIKLYEDLAKGGTGLIITSSMYLTETSQIFPGQFGLYNDELAEEYAEFTSIIHKFGSKIFAQFDHTCFNGKIVGPNDLTIDDIKVMVSEFGDAAARAKKAGFDGVEIHSAHGGLFSQFLIPRFNSRNDVYGGSIQNRARIIFEAYKAIRDNVGLDYPIAIKINSEDCLEDGMSFDECKQVCKELEKLGMDAIEISGGTNSSGPNKSFARKVSKNDIPYFKAYAEEMAKILNIPVILIGGNRDFNVMTNILNETSIEYFSISRPLLCESDLINRWQEGNLEPVKCVSCNKCLEAIGSGNEGICIFNR